MLFHADAFQSEIYARRETESGLYAHRGQDATSGPYVKKLSFGELEPLARTLLTILLALVRARVASE